MSIEVVCDCGKRLRAPENLAGKRVKCPSCGAALAVPGSEASEKSSETIRLSCPCGRHLQAQQKAAGKEVRCPACGRSIVVPAPAATSSATKPSGDSSVEQDEYRLEEEAPSTTPKAPAGWGVEEHARSALGAAQSRAPKKSAGSVPAGARKKGAFTFASRKDLSTLCFALFAIFLVIAVVAGAVGILAGAVVYGGMNVPFDFLEPTAFNVVAVLVQSVLFVGAFAAATFWYWLAESIRLGRPAKPSDVFAADAFEEQGISAEDLDKEVPLQVFLVLGVAFTVVVLGLTIYAICRMF